MATSIFSKIISGEIPCHKVYEDDKTLAFLDIHPVQPGHVLVVPKTEVEFMWDLSDADYAAVMTTAKKVAQRLREVLVVPFVGMQVIGVDVPHAHVHVIPFRTTEQFRRIPDPQAEPDHAVLAQIAKQVALRVD